MFKKIAIGLLAFTVLAAGGAAMAYNTITIDAVAAADEVLQQPTTSHNAGQGYGQPAEAAGTGERQVAAEGSLGEPWTGTGVITKLEDVGIELILNDGQVAYVELGPADYWQNQGVVLSLAQEVSIVGTINEGMIHATTVTTADGQVLQVRSESGQPLWSGGVSNEQGQNGNATGETQIVVEEWFTFEGTLMSFQGGTMTMSTASGELISFKTGQPRFFAEQGITFQVGEQIAVVGYYKEDVFQAGDITQVSTGARVMLLDPNGRPLWAGPGNGNGNGGNGTH